MKFCKPLIAEKEYRKILSLMPIACVDIILTKGRSREFLLIKRKDQPVRGYFWFPGGRILKGETIFNAAIRKAKQEIGVSIRPERIVGVYETIFRTSRPGVQGGTHTVNAVVIARIKKDALIQFDSHHTEAKWFVRPPNDFKRYLASALKNAGVL